MQRLMKVLQWNILSNKREIRRSLTGMMTAFCIITAVYNITAWSVHTVQYSDTTQAARLCLVGTGFAMLLWASQVCFNMATKTTFINYAMLPATNVEKYVANVLYQTVCRIAIVIAALIATDALQAIISLAMAGEANSLTMATMRDLGNIADINNFAGGYATALFVHSTFVLGATFFRRRQFLHTCLMWVALPFTLSLLFVSVAGLITQLYDSSQYDISLTLWFSPETYEELTIVGVVAAACLCYWLSYRLFRRSQIINNKFFN